MPVLWLKRVGNALVPDGDDSFAVFAKIPFAKSMQWEGKVPRNVGHHRLYWGLVHRIASAIGEQAETVSDLLKIETGHCTVIHSKKYGEIRLPQSIAFAKMDQAAFSEFFERCVQVIYSQWGIARSDILDAVGDLLEPKTERR